MGEGGGDFVGDGAFAASGDLRKVAAGLAFAEGEEQDGLLVSGELGEFALEVDAADEDGVEPVCACVDRLASRGQLAHPSTLKIRSAPLLFPIPYSLPPTDCKKLQKQRYERPKCP